MKIILLFICFIITSNVYTQDLSNLLFDNDTVCSFIQIDCTSQNENHVFKIESKNDSLYCLLISRYPLENSEKVLTIERNSYGDTLGIGFELEIIEKINLFIIKKPILKSTYLTHFIKIGEWTHNTLDTMWIIRKPFFKKTYTSHFEKIGIWTYYTPNGEIKNKENYN